MIVLLQLTLNVFLVTEQYVDIDNDESDQQAHVC